VGRVESVCADPAAKGPTGPFCLVHLQMRPCPSVTLPGGSTMAPALLGSEPLPDRRDVARLALASCLAAPGSEIRRRCENGLTLRSHQLDRKRLCT
jgi:hypothetical protein